MRGKCDDGDGLLLFVVSRLITPLEIIFFIMPGTHKKESR
jgi:hypothetical protein